jgi:hypothetical protein
MSYFLPKTAKSIAINGDRKMKIIVISDRSSDDCIAILLIYC